MEIIIISILNVDFFLFLFHDARPPVFRLLYIDYLHYLLGGNCRIESIYVYIYTRGVPT